MHNSYSHTVIWVILIIRVTSHKLSHKYLSVRFDQTINGGCWTKAWVAKLQVERCHFFSSIDIPRVTSWQNRADRVFEKLSCYRMHGNCGISWTSTWLSEARLAISNYHSTILMFMNRLVLNKYDLSIIELISQY